MKKQTRSKASETDWNRIDRMRDEDIDFSDIPELTAEDFARGVVRWGLSRVPRKQPS